jgi:hypothetical protein
MVMLAEKIVGQAAKPFQDFSGSKNGLAVAASNSVDCILPRLRPSVHFLPLEKTNMTKRKIVDARADSKGNITAVKLKGNVTFTPLKTAIKMTRQGLVDAVVVKPTDAKIHLRTRPDSKTSNNLDDMAGDK